MEPLQLETVGYCVFEVVQEFLTAMEAMNSVCGEFYHKTPLPVRWLSSSSLFEQGGTSSHTLAASEDDSLSRCGYVDLGSGKEMFVLRLDNVPWPLAPSTFRLKCTDALRYCLASTKRLLVDLVVHFLASACPVSNCAVTSWLETLPFERESVLFARHYHHRTDQDRVENISGVLAAAHTDSGIITLLWAPTGSGALEDLEVLRGSDDAHWCRVQVSAHDDNTSADAKSRALMFCGEMLIPFFGLALAHFAPAADVRNFGPRLMKCIAVHRVVRVLSPRPGCRHSYPFQLRLPLRLLMGAAEENMLSSAHHKMLVL